MKGPIAIVGGTGPEGRGLALRWARAGKHVVIGSRDAERARTVAQEISTLAGDKAHVEGMDNQSAVKASKTVVLTIPFVAQADTLKHLKDSFSSGTVVVDTTVPLAAGIGGKPTRTLGVWQGSAVQATAELLPDGVKLAAAFQNIGAKALLSDGPVESDVIVCSDDAHAREVASELARAIPGVRAIDGGKLENSRTVEQITALLIQINMRYKSHSAGLRLTGLGIPDAEDQPHAKGVSHGKDPGKIS
jgi:8-hydroxy-5-deazaflavin:NADPH oxidoreductase